MQIFSITDNVALIMKCFLKVTPKNNEKKKIILNWRLFKISSGSPINKQKSSALQGTITTLDLYRA